LWTAEHANVSQNASGSLHLAWFKQASKQAIVRIHSEYYFQSEIRPAAINRWPYDLRPRNMSMMVKLNAGLGSTSLQ